jgi:peptidoglycan/LPS O-acetylase OafA/YrhL
MSGTPPTGTPRKPEFRPEIEGLRAIAATLVAVFHIWLGRVSGGVDVFFVVSSFLITSATGQSASPPSGRAWSSACCRRRCWCCWPW